MGKKMGKRLLMLPGPIELEDNVLAEMSTPMVAHYGAEWTNFYHETIDMIKDILNTTNRTFIQVGSGHAAIETVIGSLIEEDDKILVLSNGFFAERNAEIVKSYNGQVEELKNDWGDVIDPQKVDEHLAKNHEKYKAVFVVHTETSTGVTNPLKEISEVVNKYNLLLYVDAVCSIGVTEFKMDEWDIDFAVTASQKGLGAPPGLSVVSVSDKGWEAIENRKESPIGWYMNLLEMRKFAIEQKEWQPYGITMAVNNVKALNTSLKNIKEEGLDNRIKRHREMAKYFRDELRDLDLEILASEESASNPITVIKYPLDISSDKLIKELDEKYNIRVANGLGVFRNKIIRVGHMNLGATKNSLVPLINALDEVINKR
ncbi:MAG: pyridoxal-phosphate-dependent aminotransferase family protein [Bacillota bacterium]